MAGKAPQAAFVEDFDEDAHAILPDTRQVANTAAKLSRSDMRFPAEPLIDGASDSGYSSRTAATVNSTQSGPSGGKSPPVPLKLDTTTAKRADLGRKSSRRKDRMQEKDKERIAVRPTREEKMHASTVYPGSAHHHASAPRSPSKSRRRESTHVRHYPDSCYECANGLYHAATPVEPHPMEYPFYMPQRSPVADYPPPSPHTPLYSPAVIQDINVSHTRRPPGRVGRSNSYHSAYHSNPRPMSFHGMLPGMGAGMYNQQPMHPYEHGPPPSSSAYANSPSFPSSPYGPPHYFYPGSDFGPPSETPRNRSRSRNREQSRSRRSSSLYGPPVVDSEMIPPWYDDGEHLEHHYSREGRGRGPKPAYERDEDSIRMPPPPPPASRHRSTPQIIQTKRPDPPRKSQTATAVPSQRRASKTMDMSELAAALPDHTYRRLSREAVIPERSQSLRDSRRSTSYHDSRRAARVAVESSQRRRPRTSQFYDLDGGSGSLEDRQREVEEYQAARSGRPSATTPLTAEALLPTKAAHRTGSESGSQKSRSNSSRGSGGSKADEDKNITMTMNGVSLSFTQESVGGKSINIRTGDTGAVRLNIEGGRRPKHYLTGPVSSDYSGGSGRRELEDGRRSREDRRSDRASRRSSRSTYSNSRYQD